MVPIPPMVVARSGRPHLELFSTKDAALEKTKLTVMTAEMWNSALVGDKRKWKVVLKLCIHWWLDG